MRAEFAAWRRIAILGSGREGLAAYDYLLARGAGERVRILTENLSGRGRESELLADGVLHVGPFEAAELERYDLLIRSPGVSRYRDCLQRAVDAGAEVTTPTSIWFRAHPDARTIVVTGTKGKSTTAALLAHLMSAQGVRVRLAGNIGTPLLTCDDHDVGWWVIELSSFQISDLEGRPTIGVVLNLSSDHLDWHGSEVRYRADKLRLAELVEAGGLIANGDDAVLREALQARGDVTWFGYGVGGDATGDIGSMPMPQSLPGRHNRANLAACLAVMDRIGLDRTRVPEGLATFEGLPHRLQRLGEVDGVEYINDSISTAPVATVAALEALADRAVVLLVGGLDRGIDWAPHAQAMQANPPLGVVALPDNGARIVQALRSAGIEPRAGVVEVESLEAAVAAARRMAPKGGVVLLSPGAPSFPHFRDYEDRGEQFERISLRRRTPCAPPKKANERR